MFLSIILPFYNTEQYLEECLDSILSVGMPLEEYEIIMINDGSTDKGKTIAENYISKHADVNIKLYSQENKGLGATRNIGIKKAQGQYIYFIDSDDRLRSENFLKIYQDVKANGYDAIFFDAEAFFEKEMLLDEAWKRKKSYGIYDNGEDLLSDFIKNHDARTAVYLYIVKKAILLDNNFFFPENCRFEDNYFTANLYFLIKKSKHVNLVAYERRVRPNSIMTSATAANFFDDCSIIYFKMAKRFEEISPLSPKGNKAYKKALMDVFYAIEKNARGFKQNEEQQHIWRKVRKIARKYNYFNWRGIMIRFAYPLHEILLSTFKTIRKKLTENC